jgi:hypothetical protein
LWQLIAELKEIAAEEIGQATFDIGADDSSSNKSERTSGASTAESARRKSSLSLPTTQGAKDRSGVLPERPLTPLASPLKHHTPVKLNVFYEGDTQTAVVSVVSTPGADGTADADRFDSEEVEWVGCSPVVSPSEMNGTSSWA